jgi:Fe2+ or Zn2+ uptake regulation protein
VSSVTETAFVGALHERGLRATPQRLIVYRVVRRLRDHATADQLLAAASRELPNVSLPTIYATLDLLEEMGAVRRVPGFGGSMLYDAREDHHHHLVCRVCGAVQDLEAEVDDKAALAAAGARGFQPERAQLTIQGLCPTCAASAKWPEPS